VTQKGLEDQLLAKVVDKEKPELEQRKQNLQEAFNNYKIQLLGATTPPTTASIALVVVVVVVVVVCLGADARARAQTSRTSCWSDSPTRPRTSSPTSR